MSTERRNVGAQPAGPRLRPILSRTIFVGGLMLGAGTGAAVQWVVEQWNRPVAPSASSGVVLPAASASGAPISPDQVQSADGSHEDLYADRYARLAEIASSHDVARLEQRILETLQQPNSPGRDWLIQSLFARLFELSPDIAVRALESADFSTPNLRAIFEAWVDVDVESAIEQLHRLSAAWAETQLALTILRDAEDVESMIGDLVAAGRTLDAAGLRVASLAQIAESDPEEALARTLQLPGHDMKRVVVEQIADAWAGASAEAALAHSGAIGDPQLRNLYVSKVYERWAHLDVRGFLGYLTDNQSRAADLLADGAASALRIAGELEPGLLLALSEGLAGYLGESARGAALAGMAAEDPSGALAQLSRLQPGPEREVALSRVAEGYARHDLEQALSWLDSLAAEDLAVAADAVHEAIAGIDFSRAVDARLRSQTSASIVMPPWLTIPGWHELTSPSQLADGLVAAGAHPELREILRQWAISDPSAAISWIQSQQSLPSSAISSAAAWLGALDVRSAVRLGDRMRGSAREEWIDSALGRAAQYDPEGAFAVLAQLQAEPFYDRTLARVISTVTSAFGPAAVIRAIGPVPSESSASALGRMWARDDPVAAKEWALGLVDPAIRSSAVESVLVEWVRRDATAAATWAEEIQDPALRALAVRTVCERSGRLGCV